MARLNARWENFTRRGHVWDRFWQDAAGTSTYTYTGSGGAVSAGTATVSKTKAPLGAGGGQAAGAASLVKAKAAQVSGGAQAAGSASISKVKAPQISGGGQAAGSAALTKARVTDGAGGATAGGSAVLADIDAPEGTGGGQSGGTADSSFTAAAVVYVVDGSGGAIAGGAATCSYEPPGAPVVSAGGRPSQLLRLPLTAADPVEAVDQVVHVYTGTGGLRAAGEAATAFQTGLVPSAPKPAAAIASFPVVRPAPRPVPLPPVQIEPSIARTHPREQVAIVPAPPLPVTYSVEGSGGVTVGGLALSEHEQSLLGLAEDEIVLLLDALTA